MSEQANIRMGVRGIAVLLVALALSACGAKVDCNSSAVKEDAFEIVQSHLEAAAWYREMKLAITGDQQLENIRTMAVDKETNRARCSGTYTLVYNGTPRSVDFSYHLSYLEDRKDTEVRVAVAEVQGGLMAIVMRERPIKNGEERIDQHGFVVVRRWKNGLEDGVQESYDRNTKALTRQYSMAAGKKTGIERAWSPDGLQLVEEIHWADGAKEGAEKKWSPDGKQLTTDLQWAGGKQTGLGQTWDGDLLAAETRWKDGNKDGLERKWVQTQVVAEINWVGGSKQGPERRWTSGGDLITDLNWAGGKETGFASMNQEGTALEGGWRKHPYVLVQLKDGLRNGPQKTYDTTNTGREFVRRLEHFKDGQLDGPAQRFDWNGGVLYEIRFAQGSVVPGDAVTAQGLKGCKQVWDNNHRAKGSPVSERGADWESWCREGRFPPA
jgi:antitoxin component YwqK of YwqJK toxin-antitoxin module